MVAKSSPFNLGLTVIPENSDPRDTLEFVKLYNAINGLAGALDSLTMPVARDQADWPNLAPWQTVLWQNSCRMYALFSQAALGGQSINLWNNGGVTNAQLAVASRTSPLQAHGMATADVNAGEYGEIILKGVLRISGLTPGTTYYLNTTAGQITSLAPTKGTFNTGTGVWTTKPGFVQVMGIALDATTFLLDPYVIPSEFN